MGIKTTSLAASALLGMATSAISLAFFAATMFYLSNRPDTAGKPIQIRGTLALGTTLPGIMIAALVATLMGHSTYAGTLFMMLQMWTIMFGGNLIAIGRGIRQGDEEFCKKCDYQKGPNASDVCPECGNHWANPFKVEKGRRIRNDSMLYAGVTLCILWAAVLLPMTFSGWYLQFIPDNVLINIMKNDESPSYRFRGEFEKRNFSPQIMADLFAHYLDQRKEHRSFSMEGSSFIKAEIGGPNIPKELVDRYYRETYELSLHVLPGDDPVGSATVSVRTIQRSFATNVYFYYYFGGYQFDGNPKAQVRDTKPVLLERKFLRMYPRIRKQPTPKPTRLNNTTAKLLPGPLPIPSHVRATVWLVAFPSTLPRKTTIQWTPSGEPVIPPNAVWHGRVDLETVIDANSE